MKTMLFSAAFAVALGAGSTALAQIGPSPSAAEPESKDDSPIESTVADDAAAPASGPVVANDPNPGKGDDEVKSRAETGDDESIYVVQERAYSKSGRFEITPMFFTAINPKFVGYVGGGLSAAYHFRENLSLEFMTSIYNGAFYSDLVAEVFDYEQLTPQDVDLKQILYFNALSLQYSALYGKLEFYGYLVDYDFYVTGGVGYARTREPCTPNRDGCSEEVDVGRGLRTPDRGLDANKITGNLGAGVRVFFHEMVGMRLELRDIVFADRAVEKSQSGNVGRATTDIRNTIMLFLGVSIMI